MFEWKRKELEVDQVKFFGGTVKKFISCYANRAKPRIKIKLPDRIIINLNPRYGIGYAAQSAYMQQQALGISMANQQAALGVNLAGFAGSASQGQCGYGFLGSLGGLASQGQMR